MITWKLFWTAGGAIATGGLAALAILTGLPALPATLLAAALGLPVVIIGRYVISRAPGLEHLDHASREEARRYFALAPAIHVVWVLLVVAHLELWRWWALVLAALAALEYGVARGMEYLATIRPSEPKPSEQASRIAELSHELVARAAGGTVTRPVSSGQAPPDEVMRRILAGCGRGFVRVTGWTPIGVDETVGIAFDVAVPAKTSGRSEPKLDASDIEPIAISASEVLAVPIHSGWVDIAKLKAAGGYRITITTRDVLAKIYPFVDNPTPLSIRDPMVIGHRLDGSAYYSALTQHWADVGMSRSGKTSLIHTKWAHITRARDAVLWVGGVEKLFDTVGGWIMPFLGSEHAVPIDWIAHGPEDTLTMMAVAMTVARGRQAAPFTVREQFKEIIVQLDEASFFLALRKIIVSYGGADLTPTQMAEVIVKGAGSARVRLHLASQRGTHNNWGECGGDISANIPAQTVFRTGDRDEIGRAVGDWKIAIPTYDGEYLFRPGTGEPPIRLKAEYIQEVDTSKPHLHDGATIADVAWARRGLNTGLDEYSAKLAGDAYRNRRRLAEDLYLYLTGMVAMVEPAGSASVEPAAVPDLGTAPVPPAGTPVLAQVAGATQYQDAMAETRELLQRMFPTPVPRIGGATPTVTALGDRVTRAQRIEQIVIEAGLDGLSFADIVAALREGGDDAGNQVVTNALTRLVSGGRINRLERNRYGCLAATTQTHTPAGAGDPPW